MKIFYKILIYSCLIFSITPSGYANDNNLFQDPIVKLIQCYPNPATTSINFELALVADRNLILSVYNFIGKKVDEVKLSSGRTSLQLDNYFRGLYVYQLRDKQGQMIESGKFQVIK